MGTADEYVVDFYGNLNGEYVSYPVGARPVVSLKTGTIYSEGDGSVNSPYIIE